MISNGPDVHVVGAIVVSAASQLTSAHSVEAGNLASIGTFGPLV